MDERFWDFFDTWEGAEVAWDEQAKQAQLISPLDIPLQNPSIPQITSETKKFLPLKGLSWVIRHDSKRELLRFFFRRPIHYGLRYFYSLLKSPSYTKEGDFFYYGIKNQLEMQKLMREKETQLFIGFSYCEKPKECPSERFSDACVADERSPVCRQCFIGKVRHALPRERTLFTIAPTINSIGEEIARAITRIHDKKIIFLIASCEMALTMFGDLANMVNIRGIGVRIQGRICNTMKAFVLSEQGFKPGMTWLSAESERRMLELVRFWREIVN